MRKLRAHGELYLVAMAHGIDHQPAGKFVVEHEVSNIDMCFDHRLLERARCLQREVCGSVLLDGHALQFVDLRQVDVLATQVGPQLPATEVVGCSPREGTAQCLDPDVVKLRFMVGETYVRCQRLEVLPMGLAPVTDNCPRPCGSDCVPE